MTTKRIKMSVEFEFFNEDQQALERDIEDALRDASEAFEEVKDSRKTPQSTPNGGKSRILSFKINDIEQVVTE